MNQVQTQQQTQSLQVQAQCLQTLIIVLFGIGVVAYFIKIGPARFFEEFFKPEV